MKITKQPLIVSEVAGLWNAYVSDRAAICVLKHFLINIDNAETRNILQHALSLSELHVKKIEDIFQQENVTIPDAFGEGDVDKTAPRLFTDSYYLFWLSTMSEFGMDAYSLAIRYTARLDIQELFIKRLTEATELLRRATVLRLSKGLFLKAPRIEISKTKTYIEKEGLLNGLLGKPRALFAAEVSNIFAGALMDIVWRALLTGFGQVTKQQRVKDFMFKGRDIASAHFGDFSKVLNDENIPISSISDSFTTDSTIAPFSEKLMLYHALSMCAFTIGVDGAAIASSKRADLLALHTKFGAEIVKYAAEGTQIMINNRWLEQPPQVVRHESLTTLQH